MFSYRSAEEGWFLLDDADVRAEPLGVDIAEVHAVDGDAPASGSRPSTPSSAEPSFDTSVGVRDGVVEPLDELHGGGFSLRSAR